MLKKIQTPPTAGEILIPAASSRSEFLPLRESNEAGAPQRKYPIPAKWPETSELEKLQLNKYNYHGK